MEIINIIPRGFCKGVVQAIQKAKQSAKLYPDEPITILGELVHNQEVVNQLELAGLKTIESKHKSRLELLDDVNSGVVIMTAHGVHSSVIDKAKSKGLVVVDASCEDVIVTQNLVDSYLRNDYEIIYIGQPGHPEAEAILLSNPSKVHLIQSIEEAVNLTLTSTKLFMTNQTTMSILDIQAIMDVVLKKYPNTLVSNEICSATRTRQEAVLNLKPVDCLLVVGDPKSNNSKMLVKIGQNKAIPFVRLVQSYSDLKPIDLTQFSSIAITAGASTPTYLINQVQAYCNAFNLNLNPDEEAMKIKPFL